MKKAASATQDSASHLPEARRPPIVNESVEPLTATPQNASDDGP
jgi:hypothetical protein